jgi:hypothetical protein
MKVIACTRLAYPSIGSPLKELESAVTGEKNWPVAVTPATVTRAPFHLLLIVSMQCKDSPVSVYSGPDTVEPSPYLIEKEPLCWALVDDASASYLFFAEQVWSVHEEDGTQRSEDPAVVMRG